MAKGKYFGGKQPLSIEVDLDVRDGFLLARRGEETLARWPLSALKRDRAHTVAVVLLCGANEERIELTDRDLLAQLPLDTSVWSWAHLPRRKRKIALWLAGVAAAVAAALSQTDRLARLIAARIPLDSERRWTETLIARAGVKPCRLSAEQKAALEKLTERLFAADPAAKKDVTIEFVRDQTKNAYTFPGGRIFVFTGLTGAMDSADELAGVLAHEIEHVQKRHILQTLVRAGLFTALLNFMLGDVSGVLLLDPATAAQIWNLRLNRAMETEADQGALRRLRAGHISVTGMIVFFERINKHSGLEKSLGFLSTHPVTDERIALFSAEPPNATLPPLLSDAEWTELKRACQDTASE